MDAFPTPGFAGEAILAGDDVSAHDAAVVDAALSRALMRARMRHSSTESLVTGDEGTNENMTRGFLLPADSGTNDIATNDIAHAPEVTAQAPGATWSCEPGRGNSNTNPDSVVTEGHVGTVPTVSTLASATPHKQTACREPTPGACDLAWVHRAGAQLHMEGSSYSRPMLKSQDALCGARTAPAPPTASMHDATAAATAEIGYFSGTSCEGAKSSMIEDFQTAQGGFRVLAPREELDAIMQKIARLYGAETGAQVCTPTPELARTPASCIMTPIAQEQATADFARFLDMMYSQKVVRIPLSRHT
jgi:hypothetical protein